MAGFDFENMFKMPDMNTVPDGETLEAGKMLRRGIIRRIVLLFSFLAALFLVSRSIVITYPNQYVAIKQFGEVVNITYEPGISFRIPFIQTTSIIPKDVRFLDIEISDVITQDKKSMVSDSFVLWKVIEPLRFIRAAGGSVNQAADFVNANTYNSLKNVISRLPQSDIISGRDILADLIVLELSETLDEYGLKMVAIETKHLDLPDDNKNAVYERMISERNNVAAQYSAEGDEEARMIRTETDKTVNILVSNANAEAAQAIAEGEQQYMEILSRAYGDSDKAEFYSFVRALDAAKVSLGTGDKTLVLGIDSPIAKIFYQD